MTEFRPADWLIVAVVTLSAMFIGMIFSSVAPVLPAVVKYYGGGDHGAFVAQWFLTAPAIGVVIGGPVSGWFIERLGARAVLTTCLVVFALAGTSVLAIDSVALLFACRFLVGLTAVGQLTAILSLVAERYPSEMRGRIVGLQSAFAIAGSIIIVMSAGRLAEIGDWRTPSILYTAAIPVLVASLALFKSPGQGASVARTGNLRALAKLTPTYLMVAATMMVTFIPTNQVPLLLAEDGVANASKIAIVMGAGSLAMALGGFSYSRVRRRFSVKGTLSIALTLLSIGLAGLSLLHGMVLTIVAIAFLSVGGGLLTPLFSHHILDNAPPAVRGRAVGFMFAAQFTGPILNSVIIAPAVVMAGRRIVIASIAVALALWGLSLIRSLFVRNISAQRV